MRRTVDRTDEKKRRASQHSLDDFIEGRERIFPATLLDPDWKRHEDAARLFFNALIDHYADCVASGRTEVWKRAAHAAVDLFGLPPHGVEFVRRADLVSGFAPSNEGGKSDMAEPC